MVSRPSVFLHVIDSSRASRSRAAGAAAHSSPRCARHLSKRKKPLVKDDRQGIQLASSMSLCEIQKIDFSAGLFCNTKQTGRRTGNSCTALSSRARLQFIDSQENGQQTLSLKLQGALLSIKHIWWSRRAMMDAAHCWELCFRGIRSAGFVIVDRQFRRFILIPGKRQDRANDSTVISDNVHTDQLDAFGFLLLCNGEHCIHTAQMG